MNVKLVVIRYWHFHGAHCNVIIWRMDGQHTYPIKSTRRGERLIGALENIGATVSFVRPVESGITVGYNVP